MKGDNVLRLLILMLLVMNRINVKLCSEVVNNLDFFFNVASYIALTFLVSKLIDEDCFTPWLIHDEGELYFVSSRKFIF